MIHRIKRSFSASILDSQVPSRKISAIDNNSALVERSSVSFGDIDRTNFCRDFTKGAGFNLLYSRP